MGYDVSFKERLNGTGRWIPVGDNWINHPLNTGSMIKEVCGSYPSTWDGKTCAELLPMLENGVKLLQDNKQKYRLFEPDNKWGTVETTIDFLDCIINNCRLYPTATVEVYC